jgi:hypothetical protein
MIRDIFIPLAELLFWFTGGELLMNTVWFLVWVVGGAVIMVLPLWFGMSLARQNNRLKWVPGLAFIVGFFPALLILTSPGIIQGQLMEECLPIQTVTVDTDLVKSVEVRIRHCRFKANYYDEEFGEWRAWAVDKRQ